MGAACLNIPDRTAPVLSTAFFLPIPVPALAGQGLAFITKDSKQSSQGFCLGCHSILATVTEFAIIIMIVCFLNSAAIIYMRTVTM